MGEGGVDEWMERLKDKGGKMGGREREREVAVQ